MADSARLVWQSPPIRLAANVNAYFPRLMAAAFELAQVFAAKVETYAKQNAPWTDRTTHARQGLTGRAFRTASAITIVLFHVMAYGIWLEVKNAGRFAIILATLRTFHPQVMAALQALMRG